MRHRGLAAFLLAFGLSGGAAHADDLLVMPFRCELVDGKPVLTPSGQEGHRVIGAREQRRVTSCSPVDPKNCRQWTAFKFDMDCDGERVSWIDVVANASEYTRRRTWMQNGQLRVQTTPPRDERYDSVCAHSMGPEWDYRAGRYCTDRFAVDAPAAVDMPSGFAPMLGLDGIFVADKAGTPGSRVTATGTLPRAPAAPPSPGPTLAVKAPQAAKASEVHAPAAVAEAKAVPKPKPAAVTLPEPPSQSAPTEPAPTEPAPAAATAPEKTVAEAPADAPVVLNAPHPAASVKPETHVAAAEPPPAMPISDPASARVADARHAQQGAASVDAASASKTAEAPAAVPVGLVPETAVEEAAPSNLIYVVAGLIGAALIAAFMLLSRLGRAQPEGATRDIGAINLGSTEPQPGALVVQTKPRDVVQRPAAATGSVLQPAGSAAIGDRMPASKAEALGILGMGVASDSNLSSLKKIVDGLRMSWHPDLARDDDDRQTRELRLKQINAAWEILGGQGAQA